MATNDLDVMEDFLTIVDREMMTSLDRMRQSRRNFDPIFKQAFMQTVNHRVASTYSKFEMKLQMELSSSGFGNGEAMSSRVNPDLGFVGKWNNRLDDFGTRDSNNIKTILQIVDSSDEEDFKIFPKKEFEEAANQNEHRESDQQFENAESNRLAVPARCDEIASTNDHSLQNGEALMTVSISNMAELIAKQSVLVMDEGIHHNNDPRQNAAGAGSGERPIQCRQPLGSVGIKAVNKIVNDKRKRHQCQICQYISCQKSNLNRHMRTHTRERPYQCERCLKRFTRSIGLKRHQLVHIKQYKFRCVGCFNGFDTESEKMEHDRKCGIRRFECHLCKKYANHNFADLKRHMRKHSGEKPFRCELCMIYFGYRSSLKEHLNNIHGRKEGGLKLIRN